MSEGFIRSNNNKGAIINTDNNALKAYKLAKKRNNEVDILKEEVKDIKLLLCNILSKLNER